MAEDLHRLVTEHLGIREKIHVVGHDIGGMVAHAYATRFADSVASVIWGECPLPGTQVFEDVKSAQALWHFAFHAVVDLPEQLTQGGREGVYLRSFYDKLKVNAKGIRKLDEEEYVAMFERPGAMRCGFELYRRFPEDAEENRKWLKEKDRCKVPVLALSGEKSPIREFAERQVKEVYEEDVVEVGFVQGAGHYVAEENPADFVERVLGFVRKHMSN